MDTETKIMTIGLVFVVLFVGLSAFAMKPSVQDIEKCVKVSNYTVKECKLELTR